MNNIIPSMVVLARESRGITQSEFASRLNVAQGTVSKLEQGIFSISDELLEKLCGVLHYPRAFFFEKGFIYPALSYHRKRQTLPQKIVNRITATSNIQRIHLRKLLQSAEIPQQDAPFMSIEEHGSPELIAAKLRKYWRLPKGPIENVTALIEGAGISVVPSDFLTHLLDGISIVGSDLPPMVFFNKEQPGDRLRFTLTHELGHIVMHQMPTETMEDEAHRFAAEFLMPADDIKSHLSSLTLEKLADLKKYWKVSMAALLKRSKDLNRITDTSAKYLWINFGKRGYRMTEPVEIPQEKPILFKQLLEFYSKDLGFSEEDIAQTLLLEKDELYSLYLEKPRPLKLISSRRDKK